jgi:ribonuclease HII
MKYIVGIDEVGRGPLAGPVTVGVVVCEAEFYKKLKHNKNLPPAGKDSKKLSEKDRQKYSEILKYFSSSQSFLGYAISPAGLSLNLGALRSDNITSHPCEAPKKNYASKNILKFHISHISNKIIDTKGLSFSIKKAIEQVIEKLKLNPKNCEVRLDGGLHAPAEFKNQKTIIRGDEKEKIIAWASILAKVSRDALMRKAGKKYPQYGFEIHKGYGTSRHRSAIHKHGLSPIHRKTFCTRIKI